MNIGIIIYTQTGNTLAVAMKLKETLLETGHKVELKHVKIDRFHPITNNYKLINNPSVEPYDMVIFGGPIHAFRLCSMMRRYLLQIDTLAHKKVCAFVTHYFAHSSLGGKQGIKNIEELIKSRDGLLSESAIINWSNSKRQSQIEEMVERFIRVV